jgi:predicted enzyme related to lactoylglutathione lyase
MQPIVVWTEIPVTDLQKSTDFYGKVFGWNM